jgi:hypothetical protein
MEIIENTNKETLCYSAQSLVRKAKILRDEGVYLIANAFW